LGSIINTLSSNILNNVQNNLESINQNVNNIVNQTLRSFGQDYQNRLKQIDDNKPNNILSNFLSLYQQAIEYIQFLGNRKNIKSLGDNLKELQRVFTETFEVAKIVRQTIVKIVKQIKILMHQMADIFVY
jgi:methionyl-tRNA synthetase